jgi:hypothetical protein
MLQIRVSLLATICFAGLLSCGKKATNETEIQSNLNSYTQKTVPSRAGELGQTLPQETLLLDSTGATKAVFTLGSRTVVFQHSQRTFQETSEANTVTSNSWVRILPNAFSGTIPQDWFSASLVANEAKVPDILALGMQYIQGSPSIKSSTGVTVAGDASYGPLTEDGDSRVGGSDIMDFIGTKIIGVLSNGRSNPKPENLGSLDCSGFIRIVFGYRSTVSVSGTEIIVPLAKETPAEANTLPRTAAEIWAGNIGNNIVPDSNVQITKFGDLRMGDLVFFRAETESERDIDHVGIYMGTDNEGDHRFLSSRKTANGPTMGDLGGASLLNGPGIYSKSFHAVKRL